MLDSVANNGIIVATMYVDVAYKTQNGKKHKRALLRESFRDNGKVKHRTIANISRCSDQEISAIKLALKHKGDLGKLGSSKNVEIKSRQGLSIGAIFLLKKLSDRLHITKALGNSKDGKLALWQIMARIINQGSRLSAVRLASTHAVCDMLGLDSFNEDTLYSNLDWLCANQRSIEERLFKFRTKGAEVPCLYLYDVTSSYLEGLENELGDWGYNRDGKKGKKQIVIGLLTDEKGVPVSVEVFKGNTLDPKSFFNQVNKLANHFKIKEVTIVGDRGMIKSTQIKQLKAEHFNYITAITKPQIKSLIKKGAIQLELFTENVCEIESDGTRYILRRNPFRAEELEITRAEKIKKAEGLVKHENRYLSEHKRAKASVAKVKVEEMLKKLKLSDFITGNAAGRVLSLKIDKNKKEELAVLDGCYVIKTGLAKEKVSAQAVHQRYKDLALVEHGFRTIKTGLLETRPIYVRKENRTRGHVFVVMLSYVIVHELQELWSSMDLTVQEAITELASLSSDEINFGKVSYNRIPKPRDVGKELFDLANVVLPEVLPCTNNNVSTRRKLPERRKAIMN